MLTAPVIECEQCNGSGECRPGVRCPCREEDDAAEARRKQMGVVRMAEPEILKQGDFIRVRRAYSGDGWCTGIVEKASLNGESVLMVVCDGAVSASGGGIIAGVIAIICDLEKGTASELITETELEVERREE